MHHCVFCGWWREAQSATILHPACERCGCTLRADDRDEFERMARPTRRRLVPFTPAANSDSTGVFGLLVVIPMLLPVFGIDLGDVVFALPMVLLTLAIATGVKAVRASGERRRMWQWLVASVVLAAAASVAGLVGAFLETGGEELVFYVGSLASVFLLIGVASFAVPCLRRAGAVPLIDAAIVTVTGGALAAVFVIVPGFSRGDTLLTLVAGIDLLALLLVVLASVARRSRGERRVLIPLAAGLGAATLGDCLVSATAAGQIAVPAGFTAVLWAVAGYVFALSAEAEYTGKIAAAATPAVTRPGDRWIYARALLPLVVILGLQVLGVALWFTGHLEPWGLATFVGVMVIQVALAFWRQARLLIENRRAVARERTAREEAQRRNEELEALTGLATTMTQTLEEAPIAEQALSVLHLAARGTSSALHVRNSDGTYELRAACGDWASEKSWPGTPTDDAPRSSTRGGRAIVRFAVAARGHRIGTVTLVRRADTPFLDRELELLGLLVDEMAVALQNARDYRERLEEAIRDPLTGLYNRRFLFEALD